MSKFNRATLAKFLPDHEAIAAFESLNNAVDVALPGKIDDTNGVAQQAFINAKQALEKLVEAFSRIEALEFLPLAAYPSEVSNDLSPSQMFVQPVDDLSPRGGYSSQSDDFAPRI